MEVTLTVIGIIVIVIIMLIINALINKKTADEFKLKNPNFDSLTKQELLVFITHTQLPENIWTEVKDKIYTGKGGFSYISGHTALDNSVKEVFIDNEPDKFILYESAALPYRKIGEIDKTNIENIILEDSSTIEQKITAGRILLTGFFALAWKKKKINELAFVTIIEKRGKFENEIVFQFEGPESVQRANTLRNYLINKIEKQPK